MGECDIHDFKLPHRYCLYLIAQISCWCILQVLVGGVWLKQLLRSSYKRPVKKRKHTPVGLKWIISYGSCNEMCSKSWLLLWANLHDLQHFLLCNGSVSVFVIELKWPPQLLHSWTFNKHADGHDVLPEINDPILKKSALINKCLLFSLVWLF